MTRRPVRADCTCPPDKPVIPIVPSHIAKHTGHFGNRIAPTIEPPEAVPANNFLRPFTQFMYIAPLLSRYRGLMHKKAEYQKNRHSTDLTEDHEVDFIGKSDIPAAPLSGNSRQRSQWSFEVKETVRGADCAALKP
jgi:hypothetical protein